jgi:hypothetical protein
MFEALSAHPAVKGMSCLTPEQYDTIRKNMAQLIDRLLNDTCRDATVKAKKYEGQTAVRASFKALGRAAGLELFSNPEVRSSIERLREFVPALKADTPTNSEEKKESPPTSPSPAPSAPPQVQ